MFEALLVINTIWFSMAFHAFSIKNDATAKIIVPRAERDSPLFDVVSQSGRFLGGMNLAFAVLNILVLANLDTFPLDEQRAVLALAFAVAHGTQFFFNLPIALKNQRNGGGVWPVLKGPMLFIFIMDFVTMSLNLVVGTLLMV